MVDNCNLTEEDYNYFKLLLQDFANDYDLKNSSANDNKYGPDLYYVE